MQPSLQEFISLVVDSGVLSADDVASCEDAGPGGRASQDARELARRLVRRGKLTRYQAETLLCGKPTRLVYGEYVLLEPLGAGGMGQVFKARHTRLDRLVAVKLLPPANLADPSAVARFQREMRVVGRIDHPNVIRALDARETDGVFLLVLELAEGFDVSQIVKRHGPLSIADACEIIRQAALGLSFIAAHQMVHRDVKPANLFLTQWGVVKILDLGLATLRQNHTAEALTATDQIVGTLDYMAPEQIEESRSVDSRADIYSLGCTLFCLLTGRSPFSDYETPGRKIHAHLHEPLPPITCNREPIPQPLGSTLHRMVAKNPDQRISSPDDVAAALEPLTSGHDLPGLIDACQAASHWEQALKPTSVHRAPSAPQASSATTSDAGETDSFVFVGATRRAGSRDNGRNQLRKFGLFAAMLIALATASGSVVTWLQQQPQQNLNGDEAFARPRNQTVLLPDGYLAILRSLRAANPGYEGNEDNCYIEDGGLVLDLRDGAEKLYDIRPLQPLRLSGIHLEGARVTDLSPLRRMPLWFLFCAHTPIEDLSPLEGMSLEHLSIEETHVTSLEPLRGMKLRYLNCTGTQVSDLTPLANMPLEELVIPYTDVRNLTPLAGMPLFHISLEGTRVEDVSVLVDMPLELIEIDYQPERDATVLRSIPTLKKINDTPVAKFWANHGA